METEKIGVAAKLQTLPGKTWEDAQTEKSGIDTKLKALPGRTWEDKKESTQGSPDVTFDTDVASHIKGVTTRSSSSHAQSTIPQEKKHEAFGPEHMPEDLTSQLFKFRGLDETQKLVDDIGQANELKRQKERAEIPQYSLEDGTKNFSKAANHAWEKSLEDLGKIYGTAEGALKALWGLVVFKGGMGGGGLRGAQEGIEQLVAEGHDTNFIQEGLALANKLKDGAFERFMWQSKDVLPGSAERADKVVNVVAAPFHWMHEELDRWITIRQQAGHKLHEQFPNFFGKFFADTGDAMADEKSREAAHYLLDFALIALPMTKAIRGRKAKEVSEKAKRGEQLTPEETKTLAETPVEDYKDLTVLDKADDAVKEKAIKEQAKRELEWDIKYEFNQFEKTLDRNSPNEAAREITPTEYDTIPNARGKTQAEQVEFLQQKHAEWMKKKKEVDRKLNEEMLEEENLAAETEQLKADIAELEAKNAELATEPTVKKSPKVKTRKKIPQKNRERLEESEYYADAEKTKQRTELYNDPAMKNKMNEEPAVALQKQVNDVNRFIHGDRAVDLDGIRDILQAFEDSGDSLRNYFPNVEAFDSFKADVQGALNYARQASGEKVKTQSLSELDNSVQLNMGIDPQKFITTFKEFLGIAKGLQGNIPAEQVLKYLEKNRSPKDLAWSGLKTALEDGIKEGKKYTREELVEMADGVGVHVAELGAGTETRAPYENLGRAMGANKGYRDRVYTWSNEEYFNYTNEHFSGPGNIFNARVSERIVDGKLHRVIEEAQSDFHQAAKRGFEHEELLGSKQMIEQLPAEQQGVVNRATEISKDIINRARTAKIEKAELDLSEISLAIDFDNPMHSLKNPSYVQRQLARLDVLKRNNEITPELFKEYSDFFTEEYGPLIDKFKSSSESKGNALAANDVVEASRYEAPFAKTWEHNVMAHELVDAVIDPKGYDYFTWSAGETVARGEGVLGKFGDLPADPVTGEVNMGTPHGKFLHNTVKSFEKRYDSTFPVAIKKIGDQLGIKLNPELIVPEVKGVRNRALLDVFEGSTREIVHPDRIASVDNLRNAWAELSKAFSKSVSAEEIAKSKRVRQINKTINENLSELEGKPGLDPALVETKSLSEYTKVHEEIVGTATDLAPYWRVKITDKLRNKIKDPNTQIGIDLKMGMSPKEIKKGLQSLKSIFSAGKTYIPKGASNEYKSLIAYTDIIHRYKTDKSRLGKSITDKLLAKLVDIRSPAKIRLDKLNIEEAYDVHKSLSVMNGASTGAEIHFGNARKPIYGKLSRSQRAVLDKVIFALRNIAIDKARAQEAIKTGKHRKVTHPKPTVEMYQDPSGTWKPMELDAKTSRKALEDLETILGKEEFNEMLKRAQIYFDVHRDMLKKLKDEGLITENLYEKLKNFDYSKFDNLIDAIDPVYHADLGGKPISVRESGVKPLQKGKHTDLLQTDSQLLLSELMQSTYGRIYRNRTNQYLKRLAEANPDNGLVKMPNEKGGGKPKGWHEIKLYEEGKPVSLFLEPEFARSWLSSNREISFSVARMAQIATGTAVLKTFATGINPGFAFANILRDVPHMWMAGQVKLGGKWTSVYSPHLPKFIAQSAWDALNVAGDVFTRKGRYMDAVWDGIGMRFLSHEGKYLNKIFARSEHINTVGDRVQAILGYLNESSEILGRLMMRERAMKLKARELGMDWGEFQRLNKLTRTEFKGGRLLEHPDFKALTEAQKDVINRIRLEGTFAARDYMDFSTHGTWGEIGDTSIPYFNPGIQGTRGLLRSAKRNPKEFATKMGWLVGTTALAYTLNKIEFGDRNDYIPEETKKNNFVFNTHYSIVDDKGQRRYVYFKIPKDPGQKYVTRLTETMVDKHYFGEDVDIPGAYEALKSLSPVQGLTNLPPTADAVFGVTRNIDSYKSMIEGTRQDIYRGPNLPKGSKHLEFSAGEFEPPVWAKNIGDILDMSPEKVEYMFGSFFTHGGNAWTYISGKSAEWMMGEKNQAAKDVALAETLASLPITRRFIGLTQPESVVLKQKRQEIDEQNALKRWTLKQQTAGYLQALLYDESITQKEYIKFMRENIKDIDYLKDELQFAKTLQKYGKNDRRFWIDMRRPRTAEEKALIYYNEWSNSEDARRKKLEKDRVRFGHTGDEFTYEFIRLKTKGLEN